MNSLGTIMKEEIIKEKNKSRKIYINRRNNSTKIK
jgi:hypothetical protein